jgi:D-3-phosphoglycerate dehydrogenase
VKVLAYDAYKTGFGGGHVKESSLQDVCDFSDIISLHLPLTTETFHFADDAFFKSLKKVPLFLNLCRGKVMETSALIRALEDGTIMGAGLDVLDNDYFTALSASQTSIDAIFTQQNTTNTNIYIGNSLRSFNGNLGVLKIYNRELSADEVLNKYNATKSRFGY